MTIRIFFSWMLAILSCSAFAQSQSLQGIVLDGKAKPMKYATISLLKPEDSTLMFFGISNASGVFEVKNAARGSYLLQSAMLGYKTHYRKVQLPVNNGDLGTIIMDELNVQQMKEVEITGERIPVLIKKDTVEYDAGAFKTKPDANTEELLKKMPGIEVDKAGNIKAQGEQVNKVLVDGKEFFGSDPKVATRNLPADAIKKVQVFDKKSDMSEFTGIDDGSRQRAINLMLKDDKKQGYFGDVTAGGGTNERFKGAAKLYRFRPGSQFAVLGMANNINRSGFSFSDYLNFSGGLQGLGNGGNNFTFSLSGNDNLPVDFGQPVTGIVTSGAGGINYSYEIAKNRRLNISYLGNGANKKLNEQTWSRNFTPQLDYLTEGNNQQRTDNVVHRLNLSIRNDMDSLTQATFFANTELSDNKYSVNSGSSSSIADILYNTQTGTQYETAHSLGLKTGASLTRRTDSGKDVFTLSGNEDYKHTLSKNEWQNMTRFLGQQQPVSNNLFRDDKVIAHNYNGKITWSHALGKGYFIEPQMYAGDNTTTLHRAQGIPPGETSVIDSLSPDFSTNYTSLRPGISLRKGTSKIQYDLGVNYERGWLSQHLDNNTTVTRKYGYILPSFMWRNEYATAKNLSFTYNTMVQAPTYSQLLSVPVLSGPLNISYGNTALRPAYIHTARAAWMLYDQFTFTSLFMSLNGTYTHDKINRTVRINNNLAQYNSLVNVPDDYTASMNVQYGRPIGKLGIKINTGLNESYNRGITRVNGSDNITTSFTHELRLGVGNRKKEKWDIELGVNTNITDARYSLQQSMNNVYYNTGGYAELSYRPGEHWYFLLAADVTRYNARSFRNAVIVPLLRSEVSYYFLNGNRGVLTLEGFDLLNSNKGLQRVSQQNYLAEVRSNIIRQYFMLSFRYRLNKAGKKQGGIMDDIDIKVR